jgi:hypothetical protein
VADNPHRLERRLHLDRRAPNRATRRSTCFGRKGNEFFREHVPTWPALGCWPPATRRRGSWRSCRDLVLPFGKSTINLISLCQCSHHPSSGHSKRRWVPVFASVTRYSSGAHMFVALIRPRTHVRCQHSSERMFHERVFAFAEPPA